MAMQVNTIRPGILVSLKTSLRGNVTYAKRDIVADHATGDGARIAKWETERTIADAEEHALAIKVRGEAAYMVQRVCASTAHGLLCRDDRREELDAAMREARAKVDAFNASARVTHLSVTMICGRVAADDAEAMRAIGAEVRGLIADMEQGVAALDPVKVRDAAKRAREVAQVLSDDAQSKVESAIETARKAATAITRAVKAGEVAAESIDAATIAKLRDARVAFLDIGAADDFDIPAGPARSIDLDAAPVNVEYSGVIAAPRSIDF